MISGLHAILYSNDPEADRAFLRDVLGFPHVDAGGGWLIFALPSAEAAVHPAQTSGAQELYLMCDRIETVVRTMHDHQVPCSAIQEQPWGRLVHITLPGGGALGIYEPLHRLPGASSPSP